MKVDLAAEMSAAEARLRRLHFNHLEALGVPLGAVASLACKQPVFGVAGARLGGDGLFEPDEGGAAVIVQPVMTAERELGDHGIADLIAWRSSDPSRWWWRRGDCWVLGEYLLEERGEPVACVETPLAWLMAGGEALCILDWSAPPQLWEALRHGPALRFTSAALKARVEHHLQQSVRLPTLELADAA